MAVSFVHLAHDENSSLWHDNKILQWVNLLAIIAIGGPHGSGKSSVAKKIAEKFGMNYVSAGQVFRQMAKDMGISLEEFSIIAAKDSNYDLEIDRRTEELAKKDNTVVDAQLAAYKAPHADIRICITASPQVRWERIARREGMTLEKARNETIVREDAERERFKILYNIDIDDMSVYDVIFNTDRLTEEEVFDLVNVVIQHVIDKSLAN